MDVLVPSQDKVINSHIHDLKSANRKIEIIFQRGQNVKCGYNGYLNFFFCSIHIICLDIITTEIISNFNILILHNLKYHF